MRILYLALIVFVLTSCGQNHTGADGQDYNEIEKYLGDWVAESDANEEISIEKAKNFDSAHVCFVNDGKTKMAFPYNLKEDKFRMHQPEYWVELTHEQESNKILWKVIRFDETDGKVVRKYVPKKK